MSNTRWYRITLTVGPIGFGGPGNKLHRAQRLARRLHQSAAAYFGAGRRSSVVRCELEEVER